MKPIRFSTIEGSSKAYLLLLAGLGALIAIGLGAAHYMEHNGHHVTGMTNQVVWGIPHVFAIFLILAASGATNPATLASVFGNPIYKPLGRLSALLAAALLVGGLVTLVLDLGRPERLIVAMTYYNFKSIFAWNIFLYTGFIAIIAIYLWTMMQKQMNKHTPRVGLIAFIWRITLTTGTGSIFGFIVARQAYDSALMAPMFVIMSLSFGMAVFLLVLLTATNHSRPMGDEVLRRMRRLLGVFVAAVLYMTAVFHLTNLYATEHHDVERFILMEGGIYTGIFWIGQVMLGGLIPLLLIFMPGNAPREEVIAASILVIVGAFCQLYVIIIGGQAFPLVLFPGMEVTSGFFDGGINSYIPSLPEVLLGLGGVAFALAIVALAVKILPFLPESLPDPKPAD